MALIEVHASGVPELSARMSRIQLEQPIAARRLVNRAAIMLRSFLREAAPVGKDKVDYYGRVLREGGTLKKSIAFVTRGAGDQVVAEFSADAAAKFVIGGTGPHDIWAGFYTGRSNKQALWWQGASHPTPYVRHPGTRANDFRRPALARLTNAIKTVLAEEAPAFIRGR